MQLRSLLFVPGDRPDRMRKALSRGADALILDLEDAVAPSSKVVARREVAAFLAEVGREVALFVRINPLDGDLADMDLDAVLPARPSGIMLPKAQGVAALMELDRRMTERGDRDGRILPIAAETPGSVLSLSDYAEITNTDVARRLCGITWGAEDLPVAVGASSARLEDGSYTSPYEITRALTLFAAAAAEVGPIETVFPAIRDLAGLKGYAERGARDGFTGMMAVHPDQVPVINSAFTPSDEVVSNARAVVAAFDANPGQGVLMLEGRMIDAPHLKKAQAVLARVHTHAVSSGVPGNED